MSNWTYVCGSMGIEKGPYKIKLTEEGYIKYYEKGPYEGMAQRYLPYPEEQFKLIETRPKLFKGDDKKKEKEAGFAHRIQVSSFPIMKREIAALMKEMPSGEGDEIFYMLREADYHRSSSSQIESVDTEKLFRKAVMEKFPLWKGISWKEYNKYQPTDLDWEEHIDDASLSIQDSLRWCDADVFYEKLMWLLTSLIEMGYFFNHGCFMFTDGYDKKYVVDIMECDDIDVSIINKETGEITHEYYKVFQYRDLSDPKDADKRYPFRHTLRKVEKPIESYSPIFEDYFPEEKKE